VDYDDSPDEARFRDEFRAWLGAHDPGPEPDPGDSAKEHAYRAEWRRTLYEGGWLGVSWPEAYGGRSLSPLYETIINEELGTAGIPNPAGPLGWLGRAILAYGTEEQRAEHLAPLLKGDTQWCQGFSEPGAGSDLAALSTFAQRDGDLYRINGQKLWTSGAQFADYCLLLARTDRSLPRHKGITCFIVPMGTEGVTVHPFQQAWGGTRFCEVFFDDAPVDAANRLGAEGDGWPLATTVLAYERGPSELGVVASWRTLLAKLDQAIAPEDDRRLSLARCYVAAEACRLRLMESLSRRATGAAPGPHSSIDKLLMIRAEQALGTLELEAAGAEAMTGGDDAVGKRYLFSRAASIYGGAEQIQRNIIAQRILGLPRK
jgi:alkylation response protein AidB-like acyl-CoA dehydrogenase